MSTECVVISQRPHKIELPPLVENKQSANSSPAGLSMTVGRDNLVSHRPSLSSQRPSLSDGPVVLHATTGCICTQASSSERDEIYASRAHEGHSSNTSFGKTSEDDVFPAARTVLGDPQQPESGYVLGLHAVPVQGQGSGGIGIAFRPVEGGAQVRCCWRFPSAPRLHCIVTQIFDQIVRINERGSAALHGGLKVGQVFCSVNGKSAARKSIAVRKRFCKCA
jgi:hypothetical protein